MESAGELGGAGGGWDRFAHPEEPLEVLMHDVIHVHVYDK